MGSAFHLLCQRYSGNLTPTALTAVKLWETFSFVLLIYVQILFVTCYQRRNLDVLYHINR